MKQQNLWVPWACFVLCIGFLITAMLREAEKGEVTWWILCGVFAAATILTYLAGKNNK